MNIGIKPLMLLLIALTGVYVRVCLFSAIRSEHSVLDVRDGGRETEREECSEKERNAERERRDVRQEGGRGWRKERGKKEEEGAGGERRKREVREVVRNIGK